MLPALTYEKITAVVPVNYKQLAGTQFASKSDEKGMHLASASKHARGSLSITSMRDVLGDQRTLPAGRSGVQQFGLMTAIACCPRHVRSTLWSGLSGRGCLVPEGPQE